MSHSKNILWMKETSSFKETQVLSKNYIVIWYLSFWEEIIGKFQDIFISDSSCRIQFFDGINTYVSLLDKNILNRLQISRGKSVGICRTDVPTRRYLFNFYDKNTPNECSTWIHRLSYEEIAALKVLNGWQGNQVTRKKPWANQPSNQLQLFTWMGGQ